MNVLRLGRNALGLATIAALLAACAGQSQVGGTSPLPQINANRNVSKNVRRAATSEYVYVSDRTQREVLVYPAGQNNPPPIRTIKGLGLVGGMTVDSSGNLYVANASPKDAGTVPEVLEYSPGGVQLVNTFTNMLSHPVNVAVGGGYLWVVDQDDHFPTGATTGIFVYSLSAGQNPPLYVAFADPSENTNLPMHGAVYDSGNLIVSDSSVGDVFPPPVQDCPGTVDVYELINPLVLPLIRVLDLSNNAQAWGLAIDSQANLYASDFCTNNVEEYQPPSFNNIGKVTGTFSDPVYETISSDNLLAVPSAGNGTNGYVTVIQLESVLPPDTITNGLEGPIGAVAGPDPASNKRHR